MKALGIKIEELPAMQYSDFPWQVFLIEHIFAYQIVLEWLWNRSRADCGMVWGEVCGEGFGLGVKSVSGFRFQMSQCRFRRGESPGRAPHGGVFHGGFPVGGTADTHVGNPPWVGPRGCMTDDIYFFSSR